ncbi:glutathione S-transferase family protein [Tritonibacter mobilis]|uniref:Glutathione S-transferase n=1 Tax=Tritonibacter mobilis F1926 TaxID=1265309 RepID=A0A1B1A0I4_9RHOB|nr:glutathione S-transferase N-terminal domain-containing protein [Tritonibacter mobilis]ANP40008.1 glutathione S-transferase [Tritonibacter mobilis F1926]KJZ22214.1 glutathione S-transferase [Tritonibacter mobilis]
MIDLYTWNTPNGRKVSILLEELNVPYNVHAVDITKGEQLEAEFLTISPNNKIPAIRDNETGVTLMESGAILIYLAEKYGQFLPRENRIEIYEWLMWQMAGFGPMLGQAHHFLKYNRGASTYAEERYGEEARRLYGVLDRRLEGRDYIIGEYTIADIACWPWVSRYEWQEIDLRDYPHVRKWYQRIAARPAVQRGYHVPDHVNDIPQG